MSDVMTGGVSGRITRTGLSVKALNVAGADCLVVAASPTPFPGWDSVRSLSPGPGTAGPGGGAGEA
ncbi:hypothetical protein FrEUN1fDRAFT_4035 [Parafrankia sp. EUN1f]|nr:hypothetical protein FrEUN1fDRAFT_4035 [Parafrankia sp. EUN1f]